MLCTCVQSQSLNHFVTKANAERGLSCRIVLMRGFDEHGFVFYTNYQSRKAAELVALAEDCRALAMQEGAGGAGAISALVRLESASTRAIRALRLPPNAAAAPPTTYADYLTGRHEAEE